MADEASSLVAMQIFKLGDNSIEKLIDLYQERPCLWDVADRSYQWRSQGVANGATPHFRFKMPYFQLRGI